MTITITDTRMTSDVSPHSASLADGERQLWELSWLPGRVLARCQVVTGMTIAEAVADPGLYGPADGVAPRWARWWPLLDQRAAELGLSGPDAVARATEPPAWGGER